MQRLIFLSLLTLLPAGFVPPALAQGAIWTAEYYSNSSLLEPATVVRNEESPAHNWGRGRADALLPADGFSARWSASQWLAGGDYLLSLQADDGVRALVDGQTVIDEWHTATGRLYQTQLALDSGTHRIVIEYYEDSGTAHIEYTLNPLSPTPPAGAPQALIETNFLNIRAQPGVQGEILALVSRGQILPVTGRNRAASWLQVDFNGLAGWINASFVSSANLDALAEGTVGAAPAGGVTATVTASRLNLRARPDTARGARRGQISLGERYPVLGRDRSGTWLWLNANGVLGWAHSGWLSVQPGLNTVPVLNDDGVLFRATVTADFLNVRAEPVLGARRVGLVGGGEVYTVIGRNADASWVQLDAGGTVGWVSSAWIDVAPELQAVAVIDSRRGDGGPAPAMPPLVMPSAMPPAMPPALLPPSAAVPPPAAQRQNATVLAGRLNVRSQPFYGARILRVIENGARYPVLGRNGDATWAQLALGDVAGWARASWLEIAPPLAEAPLRG